MFGFLKIFKRKPARTPAYDDSYLDTDQEQVAEPEAISPSPAPVQPVRTTRSTAQNGTPQNGKGVQLPLHIILSGLPLELQPRVRVTEVGDATISVPLEKVLSQLSRGSVKISFGELRAAAPDVFASANDRDRVMVPLPLAEILSRLNPALITRRRVQKQVEVPDEISSPFDPQHQGHNLSIARGKTEPSPEPAPRQATPPMPAPSAPAPTPVRNTITSAPAPVAPSMPPTAPTLIPASRAMRELGHSAPKAPAPTPPVPAVPITPIAPVTPIAPMTPISPIVPDAQCAAAPLNAPSEAAPLLTTLTALAESWPDAVRQEIVQLNLVDAKVGLPTDLVERALKQGRIAFSWKALRGWIRPAPRVAASPNDNAVLELPLKIVAPLFLARQREEGKGQQQVAIDENIPNLFFGFPEADPASRAVANATARPADTNYYVWDDSSDTVVVTDSEVKRGPSPGTTFVAKYATPNEVVSRAAGLDGVAGALIALPDGLMVASRLSPELNGDTLAAFLPQIFGKVSQCTKELRMGDLNNLNFTVGNVPWKIFRVNAIFFAAFGRTGEPLPTAQLAALAGELDHKPK
jgi:predicted regulator of Ras-like GTPase activity (Roadblock/LC7/MglB family)